jgi:hypothetical protein
MQATRARSATNARTLKGPSFTRRAATKNCTTKPRRARRETRRTASCARRRADPFCVRLRVLRGFVVKFFFSAAPSATQLQALRHPVDIPGVGGGYAVSRPGVLWVQCPGECLDHFGFQHMPGFRLDQHHAQRANIAAQCQFDHPVQRALAQRPRCFRAAGQRQLDVKRGVFVPVDPRHLRPHESCPDPHINAI